MEGHHWCLFLTDTFIGVRIRLDCFPETLAMMEGIIWCLVSIGGVNLWHLLLAGKILAV